MTSKKRNETRQHASIPRDTKQKDRTTVVIKLALSHNDRVAQSASIVDYSQLSITLVISELKGSAHPDAAHNESSSCTLCSACTETKNSSRQTNSMHPQKNRHAMTKWRFLDGKLDSSTGALSTQTRRQDRVMSIARSKDFCHVARWNMFWPYWCGCVLAHSR